MHPSLSLAASLAVAERTTQMYHQCQGTRHEISFKVGALTDYPHLPTCHTARLPDQAVEVEHIPLAASYPLPLGSKAVTDPPASSQPTMSHSPPPSSFN